MTDRMGVLQKNRCSTPFLFDLFKLEFVEKFAPQYARLPLTRELSAKG